MLRAGAWSVPVVTLAVAAPAASASTAFPLTGSWVPQDAILKLVYVNQSAATIPAGAISVSLPPSSNYGRGIGAPPTAWASVGGGIFLYSADLAPGASTLDLLRIEWWQPNSTATATAFVSGFDGELALSVSNF